MFPAGGHVRIPLNRQNQLWRRRVAETHKAKIARWTMKPGSEKRKLQVKGKANQKSMEKEGDHGSAGYSTRLNLLSLNRCASAAEPSGPQPR